jgi:hypothetical protein
MSMLAPVAPKLGKLLRMLSSSRDGEIVAALHALRRALAATMATTAACATDKAPPMLRADFATSEVATSRAGMRLPARLPPGQSGFAATASKNFSKTWSWPTVCGGGLTEKQEAWLRAIYVRCRTGL